MELQFGLAIVDQMNGGKETRRRMQGWMHGESRAARRLRESGVRVLLALATRLSSEPDESQALGRATSKVSA
jgi:hypothetical protein